MDREIELERKSKRQTDRENQRQTDIQTEKHKMGMCERGQSHKSVHIFLASIMSTTPKIDKCLPDRYSSQKMDVTKSL